MKPGHDESLLSEIHDFLQNSDLYFDSLFSIQQRLLQASDEERKAISEGISGKLMETHRIFTDVVVVLFQGSEVQKSE